MVKTKKINFDELGDTLNGVMVEIQETLPPLAKEKVMREARSAMEIAKNHLEFTAPAITGKLRDSYKIGEDDNEIWIQSEQYGARKYVSNYKDSEKGFMHISGKQIAGTGAFKTALKIVNDIIDKIKLW